MKAHSFAYDLFVIGGGSGGMASAKAAANLKAKVGLANFVKPSPQGTVWGMGGTCVNVGCVPKKMFHFSALLGELREDQKECGWSVKKESQHNWGKMIEKVTSFIKRLNGMYQESMDNNKEIDYFNAYATLKDRNTVRLVDVNGKEEIVTAKYIIITGGGRPSFLNIPNAKELCITSDDIFWTKKDPGKTLVVGSGYIGLECAGFLKGFGKDVDVIYRSQPLRGFDRDMVNRVTEYMVNIGVSFMKGNVSKLEKNKNGGVTVTMKVMIDDQEDEMTMDYDTVLMAVGRTQTNRAIIPEDLGIELTNNGKIPVDMNCKTSIDNIYAVGDGTTRGMELTPLAIREGRMVAEGLFNNNWINLDYKTIPTTVFTPLEYSFCGYSEIEAHKAFGEDNVDIYHTSFKPLEWNFLYTRPADICYTKVIVLRDTLKVIGVHYVGPNAGEIMQGYAIAVRLGLSYEDFQDTVGIHPTTAEEMVTLETTKRENPVAQKTGC